MNVSIFMACPGTHNQLIGNPRREHSIPKKWHLSISGVHLYLKEISNILKVCTALYLKKQTLFIVIF